MDQSLNTPLSNLIDKPDLEKLIKLLKEQKVRLIVEPDSYTTLNKTIEEFKRELNVLLKNERVTDQEKEALKSADLSSEGTSIESLIALDNLLEKTNLRLMEDCKGPDFIGCKLSSEISINYLGITRIPAKFIDKMKDNQNLRKLELNHSAIAYLPDEIGNLKSLEIFSVYWNRLSRLPDSFFNLTALRTFRASNNQLCELSGNIRQLTSLRHLDLIDNKLSTLPGELSELSYLVIFDIQGNPFKSFPESLKKLLTHHYSHSLLKLIQPESDSKNGSVSDVTTNPNSNSGTLIKQPAAQFTPGFAGLNISDRGAVQYEKTMQVKNKSCCNIS